MIDAAAFCDTFNFNLFKVKIKTLDKLVSTGDLTKERRDELADMFKCEYFDAKDALQKGVVNDTSKKS